MGEMKGGMKGEMKTARCLCLKGLMPSNGRDEAFFVNYFLMAACLLPKDRLLTSRWLRAYFPQVEFSDTKLQVYRH